MGVFGLPLAPPDAVALSWFAVQLAPPAVGVRWLAMPCLDREPGWHGEAGVMCVHLLLYTDQPASRHFRPPQALAAVIFTTDSASGSAAGGGASPAAPPGSTVGVMSGNAAGPGFGLGAASMDASSALLLSNTGNTGDNITTARALLATEPATAAGGLAGPAAVPPPRQLGFAVQTNSSVQWFKGKYQSPDTYIQVRLCI